MEISKLSVYNNITLDKSRKRPGAIVRLTPHCFVGQVTVQRGVDCLANKNGASVNYVVANDGKVGCNIPEDNGAWTSSSKANDEIAIEKTGGTTSGIVLPSTGESIFEYQDSEPYHSMTYSLTRTSNPHVFVKALETLIASHSSR